MNEEIFKKTNEYNRNPLTFSAKFDVYSSVSETQLMLRPAQSNNLLDVQDYLVITADSMETLHGRILELKALQHIDDGYYHLIQIHGCVKFNDLKNLKNLLKECLIKHGNSFLNRIVKYAAQFCYNQSEIPPVMQWSTMMAERKEHDWQKAFNAAILASPGMETQLYSAMIMLIPNPTPKAANRVFTSLAKMETLPPCFEFLAKQAFQHVTTVAFHKPDVEQIASTYLNDVHKSCMTWRYENKESENSGQEAQAMFITRTLEIANKTFGIIRPGDETLAQSVIDDPFVQVENPTQLFIEYFVQYVKLGMFVFDKGDKLIAWNYYYDDRWCGYDRTDLFGDQPKLTQHWRFCSDFKFAGPISQHPHHVTLMLAAKVFDWMSADTEMFDRLMKKYQSEDLIQFFAIALSFTGSFKKTLWLFEKYKDKMITINGYLCLHLCYMYSCAREGMAKESLSSWVHIMESATKHKLLSTLTFPPNSFPLPSFVESKYVAQFACRMLRNCLWTVCIRDGADAWKKYGFILVHLCDALEESFLNHNMIRLLFHKIKMEDLPIIVTPLLAKCIRSYTNYWECMDIAQKRGYILPENIAKTKRWPFKRGEYNTNPRFLLVYNKLKRLDEMFYEVMTDLPKIVFSKINDKKLNTIENLSVDKQETIKEIIAYHKEKERKALEKAMRLRKKEKEAKRARKLEKQAEELEEYGHEPARKKKKKENKPKENGKPTKSVTSPFTSALTNGGKSAVVNMEVDANGTSLRQPPSPIIRAPTKELSSEPPSKKTSMEVATSDNAIKLSEPTTLIPAAEIKQELADTEMNGDDSKDDDDAMPVLEKEVDTPVVENPPKSEPVEGESSFAPALDDVSNGEMPPHQPKATEQENIESESSTSNAPADGEVKQVETEKQAESNAPELLVESVASEQQDGKEKSAENASDLSSEQAVEESNPEESPVEQPVDEEINAPDSPNPDNLAIDENEQEETPVHVLEREKEGDAGEQLPVDAHFVEAESPAQSAEPNAVTSTEPMEVTEEEKPDETDSGMGPLPRNKDEVPEEPMETD
ncbi:hypothetical protein CAEBREN_11647 [Caenorhabditis brenneri]|uniref:Uncharacterized protein n=1 Tax=Caenorhabditis brenneri TaxID=135651 RepID=G0MW49_CAEBE|nr:hypothetical protein CAEBREN_11647 [Caenorhabditis brenneri]